MSLGMLLLKKSGRQGSLKFIITLIAAAIGTLIILGVSSITNAVNEMNQRSLWQGALINTGTNSSQAMTSEELLASNAVISVQQNSAPTFLDKNISQYGFYFTGGTVPKNSPLTEYPKAGEYYVSPGLEKLMNSYPDEILRNRFEGKQGGLIPDAALSSPDALVIIHGVDPQKLQEPNSYEAMNGMRVTDFSVSAFGAEYQKQQTILISVAMAIGALGLLVPVMMLITTATRLGAREREARYAALRLIGATRQQVRRIMFIDSLAASLAGVAIGGVLYLLLRPLLFHAQVFGQRFFPQDITISPLIFIVSVVVIVAMIWEAGIVAMHKANTSPLGVARKQKVAKVPRAWSIIPLLLTLGGFGYFSSFDRKAANATFGNIYPFYILGLFVLMIISLLLAGPWLTKLYGRFIGKLNKTASGLLVSRRISYDARKIFQGIGGVVIAFYAGAFFMTTLATIMNLNDISLPGTMKVAPDNSLYIFSDRNPQGTDIQKAIDAQDGYQTVPVTIYSTEGEQIFMSCLDVERFYKQTCSDRTKYVQYSSLSSGEVVDIRKLVDTVPALPNGASGLAQYIYIPKSATSVQPVDAEKIVTVAMRAEKNTTITIINSAQRRAMMSTIVQTLSGLLYVGIFLTIVVASLNLIVATVSGLFDRKGSFFTLRLGGAGLSMLKRVVTRESMLPLVFISFVAIACGLIAAYVFLKLTSDKMMMAFVLPEPLFWISVVAAFILSYVGIRAVLPMLERLTTVENNRSE